MEEYKPNSHLSKEKEKETETEEKKVEKVVSGKVTVKKKNELAKVKDIFISDEASSIKSYILLDVLVPAIKKAVRDIVTDGIEMLLYGSTGHKKSTNASYVSYDRFSSRRDDDRYQYDRQRTRLDFEYDDIILESRSEAEEVISSMDAIIDEYGVVSVGDFYDLVGITTNNYAINKYGWTNVRTAEVIRTNNGYRIRLPKALPIK